MKLNCGTRMTTLQVLIAGMMLGVMGFGANQAGAQIGASFVPTISTLAGTGIAGYSGDGGVASAAKLSLAIPSAAGALQAANATFDGAGNLYFSDTNNNVVRRIDAVTGIITTVAGTGTAGYSGDGGLATAAQLNQPSQVSFDQTGNLYIADTANCAIREVMPTGMIITTLGNMTNGVTPTTGVTCGTPQTGKVLSVQDIQLNYGVVVNSAQFIVFSNSNRIFRDNGTNIGVYIGASNSAGKYGGDGGLASAALLNMPTGLAVDGSDNIYFTDRVNHVVRKYINSSQTLVLFAGTVGTSGSSGDGGAATSATLNSPSSVAVDALGNVYIADTGNNKIRVVSAAGTISTLAGTGNPGYGGDNGPATAATLSAPTGVAVTSGGDKIAIVDTNNNVVRIVSLRNGFPATSVGSSSATQGLEARATSSGTVSSVMLTSGGTDFAVSSTTGCPGAITAGGTCNAAITFTPTIAGIRTGRLAVTDSTGAAASVGVVGLGLAPEADFNVGPLTTFAGKAPTPGSTGDGGPATSALLSSPSRIAMDSAKNLYIVDTGNNRVRMVSAATGVISAFAGTGAAGSAGDGNAATAATLSAPGGIALDAAGNVYIADTGNNKIRVVNAATGIITTFAGTGAAGSTGDLGAATAAQLNAPRGMAFDLAGNLFLADTGNNKIREIFATGAITTIAGTGAAGPGASANGKVGTSVTLNGPRDVAYSNGKIYFSDTANSRVLALTGLTVQVVAGNETAGFAGDGGAATVSELNLPNQLALDSAGNLYIADSNNERVRVVSVTTGNISTVAGTGPPTFSAEGTLSTQAALSNPSGLALDPQGNLYVADAGNNRVALIRSSTESMAFGTVNHGVTTAAQTFALQNYGNQPLTLASIAVTPASYAQQTGATGDCTPTMQLAAGAQCNLRITFSPTQNGSIPGAVVITDNSNNTQGSTQTINLTGTGVVTPANITISAGNGQTGPPNGVFPVALKVLVTDASGYQANGVNVTFTAPATGVSGTFSNGTNTITVITGLDGTASATFQAGSVTVLSRSMRQLPV